MREDNWKELNVLYLVLTGFNRFKKQAGAQCIRDYESMMISLAQVHPRGLPLYILRAIAVAMHKEGILTYSTEVYSISVCM